MDIALPHSPNLAPTGHGAPLIHVRGLELTVPAAAGPVNILKGIDLDIGTGEAVGIVGASGSGKTSLLMVLAGLERATAGIVHVAGQDLRALDEDALARFRRQTVGIVFQSFHLIPTMTALGRPASSTWRARICERWTRTRWPGSAARPSASCSSPFTLFPP